MATPDRLGRQSDRRSVLSGFLRGAGGLSAALLVGCGSDNSENLQMSNGQLVDNKLPKDSPITGLTFEYDPRYEGGSILMQFCIKGPKWYRVTSQEKSPNPRDLFDGAYDRDGAAECDSKHPVTEFKVGDAEIVLLGVGDTKEETYQNMRAYKITRTEKGLTAQFLGLRTLDPNSLHPEVTPKPTAPAR